MRILGIETSCDETGASVVEDGKILSNVISTSLLLHAKTGGIIPEIAARAQIHYILPVIEKALKDSGSKNVDAIAVTVGPGLIGSLLVGVETAKTLAFLWKKSIIPVNHLVGHIYANWLVPELNARRYMLDAIEFPLIALVVSGGHTDLVLMESHGKIRWLGGTRDDAAGEALDKIGRILGFPYPSGPIIEQEAKKGNPKAFLLPRPMVNSKDFDFSFSGLKTAVFREFNKIKQLDEKTKADICACVQQAIIDVLVLKTVNAAKKYNAKSILLGGGVAANQKLREDIKLYAKRYGLNAKIFCPTKNLCTDNAAMIAQATQYNNKEIPWKKLYANPELYFD